MFDRLRAALRPTLPKIEATEAAQPPAPMGPAPIQTEPPKTGIHYLINEHTGQAYGEEHYNEHGKLDRGGDFPAVHIYPHDDFLRGALFHHCPPGERKEWLSNGLHDRAGKPAIEDFGPDTYEAHYLCKGVLHNESGPAVVIDGPDGLVREWWKNGVRESRFEEFHNEVPDYQAPGGARGGIAYRQEVFDKSGATIFFAASSTDPFSWGERREQCKTLSSAHERLSLKARLTDQRTYFDSIGGMSPWDNTLPTMGHFPEGEVQDTQQDRAKGPISHPNPRKQEIPMFDKTKTTGPNAGLRMSPNADGGVVSTQYFRHGLYTETPPNPEGLMVNPTRHPKAPGSVSHPTAPGPVSEEWYKDGKRVSAEDWYKDGAPTPRPGGVKAAAAAAAAKQAQPEVIAKTGPKKARDDDQR